MHTTLGSSPLIDCPRARKVDRQLLQSHTCLGGKQQPSRQGVQAVCLSVGKGGDVYGAFWLAGWPSAHTAGALVRLGPDGDGLFRRHCDGKSGNTVITHSIAVPPVVREPQEGSLASDDDKDDQR